MRRLALLALLVAACDVSLPEPQGRSLTEQQIRDYYDTLGGSTVYFRDPKTGACFAQPGGPGNPITSIECTEQVLRHVVNAQTEAPSDSGAP